METEAEPDGAKFTSVNKNLHGHHIHGTANHILGNFSRLKA